MPICLTVLLEKNKLQQQSIDPNTCHDLLPLTFHAVFTECIKDVFDIKSLSRKKLTKQQHPTRDRSISIFIIFNIYFKKMLFQQQYFGPAPHWFQCKIQHFVPGIFSLLYTQNPNSTIINLNRYFKMIIITFKRQYSSLSISI